MKIIDIVINQLNQNRFSSSSGILAHSLYSACHHGNFPGPNLLNVASILDSKNRQLFFELATISHHPDYSNDDQSKALKYINEHWSECIEKWKTGQRCQ